MPIPIIGKLFGLTKIPLFDQIGSALDELHFSGEEKAENARALMVLEQSGALAQIETNKLEVQHRSVFVAGWRPAIGWVGAMGLFYHFILFGLLSWGFAVWAPDVIPPPELDITDLIAIITGMLGLSWMRSKDKAAGVTRA